MKRPFMSFAFSLSLIASSTIFAQAPTAAPPGSTGLCKDGSFTSNETKKGACAGHKGVKDWYVAGAAAASGAATAKTAAPSSTTAPAATSKKAAAASTTPAPGGGPGLVWVNSNSKVYHCTGTKYYGTTKQGEYMSEAAAKSAGNHADHGKSCAS